MSRIICVPGTVIEPGKFYSHPDAIDVGGCSEGCCDDYRCPNCGTEYRVEWPD